MEGDAVTRISELARQGADPVKVGGAHFAAAALHQIQPTEPEPDALVVHTLDGLIDYLEENQDDLEPGGGTRDGMREAKAVVHVVSPSEVRVVSNLRGAAQRFVYARATYSPRVGVSAIESGFSFGEFYSTEKANISLQALFEEGGDRAKVLKLLGNVEDAEVRTEKDDGVSQTVTARSELGIDREEVPNPVELAPHRTFPEVDQPVSPFILRMRKTDRGIGAALFEADGGAWKLEAIDRVADFLEEEVEFPVLS